MGLDGSDIQALWLTFRLAGMTTAILFLLGTPLAWALARGRGAWRSPLGAVVSLPLVLPPSVLGFYLLLAMGPGGFIGKALTFLRLDPIAFTFPGLVFASVLYSLPFMVQPLQAAFEDLGKGPLEAAATLRASPLERFFTVVLPLSRTGFFTAGVMAFTHTVGEFGVVLMIGGNRPGVTKVASVAIYDHVDALEYAQAHRMSGILLAFSFVVLVAMHRWRRRGRRA